VTLEGGDRGRRVFVQVTVAEPGELTLGFRRPGRVARFGFAGPEADPGGG